LTKEMVFDLAKEEFQNSTKVLLKYNPDFEKDVVHVYNNDIITEEVSKGFRFLTPSGKEIHISQIGEVSTWKEEAIKKC
ncbi:MAG: hypothetical protein EBU53_03070, partial [Proteobacteria bacterium]|nr:hypothetical protein [Pseudomonadota bacterium]